MTAPKNRPHCQISTSATAYSAVAGSDSSAVPPRPTHSSSQFKMPISGEYMNFQMKAADTRGSSTGTISSSAMTSRVRPLILSNRNTASSTPTISEPATVTTSHIADTCTALTKRRSPNRRMKLAKPT